MRVSVPQTLIILLWLSSCVTSGATLETLYCHRVVSTQVIWNMGEKLNKRFHRSSELLQKENLSEAQMQSIRAHHERILRALKSAEQAWYQSENDTLVNAAIADYVSVFDRVHYRSPGLFPHLTTQEARIEKARDALETRLTWESSANRALNVRRNYGFTYDIGISSWEEVLLSWALQRPMVALSDSPRNRFDAAKRQSMKELIEHDLRHYQRDFLTAIKGIAPKKYFQSRLELSPKEVAEFQKKMRATSMMILRSLEIMMDETTFPSKRERYLARALIFQVIHETDLPIVTSQGWSKATEQYRNQIAKRTLLQAESGFYGEFLKNNISDISVSEALAIFERIAAEFKKQNHPSWIPPELR